MLFMTILVYGGYMKTLSIKCQNAYLICLGIKYIENRTWRTQYRGELLIHSSVKDCDEVDLSFFPGKWRTEFNKSGEKDKLRYVKTLDFFYEKLYKYYGTKDVTQWKNKKYFLKSQAIIGRVELVDIINNSKSEWAIKGNWHWVLKNAELFKTPLLFIKGKLKLFEYNYCKMS